MFRWDKRTENVWITLWVRVSSAVTRSLNVGSSLGITALVQEDLDKMAAAMDCVPRSMRAESLTAVDVNGVFISPLYFSVGEYQLLKYLVISVCEYSGALVCTRVRAGVTKPDDVSFLRVCVCLGSYDLP